MSDPMLPPGTNYCKCPTCGLYFGGVANFDLHRGGGPERVCLPPSEVTDKKGRRMLRLNDRGYWVREYK